jgi:uncharacterized protein YkwD
VLKLSSVRRSLATLGALAAIATTGVTTGLVGAATPAAQAANGAPVTGFSPTPSGNGYWTVASDGDVVTSGDATDFGDMSGQALNRPIVGMASTPDGQGYWLVASDGGIFAFGNATFFGSTGGLSLNQPIVGMAATSTGRGYWLVATDGGIFAFGDAGFYGSTGGFQLVQAIADIAPSASGRGYWLVATDGGIFAFGDAGFHGSAGGQARSDTIVGMASTTGAGYWLVTGTGQVFAYGDAPFYGSAPALGAPVAGILRSGNGYVLAAGDGTAVRFSPSGISVTGGAGAPATRAETIAREIFAGLNQERAARGLAPLAWDPQLAGLANEWSTQMAGTGNFAHRDLGAVIRSAGWQGVYTSLGENIITGGGLTSNSSHAAWMNSPGHRQNLLQQGYDTVGIAVFCDADGRMWATQNFGRHLNTGAPALTPSSFMPPLDPFVAPRTGGTGC